VAHAGHEAFDCRSAQNDVAGSGKSQYRALEDDRFIVISNKTIKRRSLRSDVPSRNRVSENEHCGT